MELWKDPTALEYLNWEEQWSDHSVHQNQTLLCRQKQGGGGWGCVICPFNFPVKLCSPWDPPVRFGTFQFPFCFSAGFCPPAHRRRTQVYFFWCHKLSSNPSWWLRRECEEQGQCHIILSHKYMARIYTPSSWERHVQDFVICSSSELIAANGVMLHKWDWCLCGLLDSWPL